MTAQLALYNKALRHCRERPLANLTEARDARRFLDAEYADALLFCLQRGYWNFAIRAIQIDPAISPVPGFGLTFSYPKPADWVRTHAMSTSDRFDPPLMHYQDQAGYWLADVNPLYVRFVSSTLGANLALFTPAYSEYVGAYLAMTVVGRIAASMEDAVGKTAKGLLIEARALDAMDEEPGRPPRGTWVSSRAMRGSIYSNPYRAP